MRFKKRLNACFKSKKGIEIVWSNIITIVFVALLIILLGPMVVKGALNFYNTHISASADKCPGSCESYCIDGKEIEVSNVKCTDDNDDNDDNTADKKVCCRVFPEPVDSACKNKKKAESCGTNMICTRLGECVTKCDYCAQYPEGETLCNIIAGNLIGNNQVNVFDSSFSCSCSNAECTGSITCIKNMCPSTDSASSNYMCCNKG